MRLSKLVFPFLFFSLFFCPFLFSSITHAALPTPWVNTEIGTAVTSSADLVNNQFTISARGIDIGGNSDTFDFVNQLFSGDVELIAKVESFGTATAAPKAGLMIRETLTTGSKKTISEVDNLQTLKQLTHNSRIPRNLLFSPEITDVFL